MAAPWTPGWRRVPASIGNKARLGSNVIARAIIESYTVHVVNEPDLMAYADDGSPAEEGPEIHLQISRSGGKYVRLLLGRMNMEELNALKEIIDFAFEQAMPVAEHRDKVAKEAENGGDYSYARRLRSNPSVHVLKRPGEQFDSELHSRRESAVPGDGGDPGSPEGSGGDGGNLADPKPPVEVTGDSSQATGGGARTGTGVRFADPAGLQRPNFGRANPDTPASA